jgi:hypothetical protein
MIPINANAIPSISKLDVLIYNASTLKKETT